MPRDVFPRDMDRAMITAFLEGLPNSSEGSDTIRIKKSTLYLVDNPIAHYDTAGTLVGTVDAVDWGSHYVRLAVNNILEQLGSPDRMTYERARVEMEPEHDVDVIKWFIGDQPIAPRVPFIICGPLGIAAWRAARGIRPRRIR